MGKIQLIEIERLLIVEGILYKVTATMFRNEVHFMGGGVSFTAWQFGTYSALSVSPEPSDEVRGYIQHLLTEEINTNRGHVNKVKDELESCCKKSSIDWPSALEGFSFFPENSKLEVLMPKLLRFARAELRVQHNQEETSIAEDIFRILYSINPDGIRALLSLCGFLHFIGGREKVIILLLEDYSSRMKIENFREDEKDDYYLFRSDMDTRYKRYASALELLNHCRPSSRIMARMIRILYYSGDYSKGASLMAEAPSAAIAYWASKCLVRLGEQERAIEVLRPFVRIDRVYRFLTRLNGVPRELLVATRKRIFISSVSADSAWSLQTRVHLMPYVRRGWLDVWDESQCAAGMNFEDSITDALSKAEIVLILVSPDYLANEFVHDFILPRIKASLAK